MTSLLGWLRIQIHQEEADHLMEVCQYSKHRHGWSEIRPGKASERLLLLALEFDDEDHPEFWWMIKAHTAILDLHPVRSSGSGLCNECSDPYPCGTLRALALAYQHRPGYRPEWRP